MKIFGLNALPDRALPRAWPTTSTRPTARLALRRAAWGGLFTAIGTVGYYVAYAYIAWRTLRGEFSIGDLTFLAGLVPAPAHPARRAADGLLAASPGQALYLDDLFSFFEIQPEILSPPNPLPFPEPIREGFVFEDVGFRYPGAERWAVRHLELHAARPARCWRWCGENGAGKTTLGEAADPALRPRRGPHPARRPRPARLRPRRAARQHRA